MLPNLVSLIPLHSPALLPTLHLSTALVYATGPPYPLISLPTLPSCSLRAPLWISPALFTALFTDCARIFLLLYMFQPILWHGAVGQVPLRDFRISLMGHNTIKTEEEVVFFLTFLKSLLMSQEALTSSWLYSNETIREGKKNLPLFDTVTVQRLKQLVIRGLKVGILRL